jgi:hypothetical protein
MRAFNRSERKAILEFLLRQLETNNYFKIFLLKNDYSIGNLEFCYFEDKTLYILESSSGYDEDYFGVLIDAKPVIEIIDDFIKNEILKKQVYSESESIDYLKYLITLLDS